MFPVHFAPSRVTMARNPIAGRVPNVKGLGLDEVGVKTGSGGEVLVDDFSRTNVPSIWAVGDVTNRIQLTPVALMEVRRGGGRGGG